MAKRGLSQKELEEALEHISSSEDEPFSPSGSEYMPSDVECEQQHNSATSSESDFEEVEETDQNNMGETENVSETFEEEEISNPHTDAPTAPFCVSWRDPSSNFKPKLTVPNERKGVVTLNVDRGAREIDVFLKLFPRSLFMHIASCTNERIQLLQKQKNKRLNMKETDMHEIMLVLGCTMIMCYNKVPAIAHYWSNNESLANSVIKKAISRDRCVFLLSKMYYNNPQKPADASKIYYIEEVVSCLKYTFQRARTESSHQSVDESMTKFKGRSALKQYLPLKPIKRGIKLWQRCDSLTGYIYDFNIYSGKETDAVDGTLGERVVGKLASTIQSPDVCLCFDRFFTSYELLNTLNYPCLGTCMSNRKNVPKFAKKKMQRGESDILVSDDGILATRWKDTKDVLLMSNCHGATTGLAKRTLKTGDKTEIECPDAIIFYNKFMGGVDLADQKVSTYDLDRKSAKWWRKVFYKLLMSAVVNSWIIFNEIQNKKNPLLNFLVPLAEQLIELGRSGTRMKRRLSGRSGRHSNRRLGMMNVGDHLPKQIATRRRCHRCSQAKKEVRTKTICVACDIPLCKECFLVFHT